LSFLLLRQFKRINSAYRTLAEPREAEQTLPEYDDDEDWAPDEEVPDFFKQYFEHMFRNGGPSSGGRGCNCPDCRGFGFHFTREGMFFGPTDGAGAGSYGGYQEQQRKREEERKRKADVREQRKKEEDAQNAAQEAERERRARRPEAKQAKKLREVLTALEKKARSMQTPPHTIINKMQAGLKILKACDTSGDDTYVAREVSSLEIRIEEMKTALNTLSEEEASARAATEAKLRRYNIPQSLPHPIWVADTLQHTAAQCSTLQHTAPHCYTLQLTECHSTSRMSQLPNLLRSLGYAADLFVNSGANVYINIYI